MNKKKNKIKNQRGITLIALVITIVVLVILVGVTVSAAINTGIIANSKKAVRDYETKQNEEEELLSYVEAQMDFLSSSSDVTVSTGSVETEVAGIEIGTETYITGVQADWSTVTTETVSSFESRLPDGYTIYKKDGVTQPAGTARVTTGMIVNKGNKKVGTIIVYGDILGVNGISSGNVSMFLNYLLIGKLTNVVNTQAKLLAADVNHDGVVNAKDYELIDDSLGADATREVNQNVAVSKDLEVITRPMAAKKHLSEQFKNNYNFEMIEETNKYTCKITVGSSVTVGQILTDTGITNCWISTDSATTDDDISDKTSTTPVTNGAVLHLSIYEEGYVVAEDGTNRTVGINIVVE